VAIASAVVAPVTHLWEKIMDRSIGHRGTLSPSSFCGLVLAAGFGAASVIGVAPAQAQEMCGGASYPFPYTDVSGVPSQFCPAIMEAYVTGISRGTTPTTFSPNQDLVRYEMVTFLQRTADQVLTRGSRRAALKQWWTPQSTNAMQTIPLTGNPQGCASDGTFIWTTTNVGHIVQIQAGTGFNVNHWNTSGVDVGSIALAAGKVFAVSYTAPGVLYALDPTQAPTPLSSVATLPDNNYGIAFDGTNLWTANNSGSVSRIDPVSFTVTTTSTGFTSPYGILYDGAHIWVTDDGTGALLQVNPADGAILMSVPVGSTPAAPVFDGTNIWVPNAGDSSVTVVQANTGDVVATIPADGTNGLDGPQSASFDGERILVTNYTGGSVTIFKAADLSFIANVSTGAASVPLNACSDGINFWVPLGGTDNLLRF
jgi:hypothetical protein